jgi:hypothetical protein
MLKGIKSVDYSKAIRPLISVKRGKRPYLFYLATELSADVIYVVKDGQIAEQGTHAELFAANGVYRQFYDKQFKSEIEKSVAAEPEF